MKTTPTEPEPIVPKKKKAAGQTRSLWADDDLWDELAYFAKKEGYSTSKFASFILRGGIEMYKKQRALEAGKSASDKNS